MIFYLVFIYDFDLPQRCFGEPDHTSKIIGLVQNRLSE